MKATLAAASVLVCGAVLMALLPPVEACSCLLQHPQTAFCESDYVIVAQVVRKTVSKTKMDAYKIAIKKEYKMSDAAREGLRHGKLYTAPTEPQCGIRLEPNKVYVIAANTPTVGLCNFVRPYSELTIVEKRGLAGVYRKGCGCNIQLCFNMQLCRVKPKTCNWSPFTPKGECERSYGSCVPAGRAQENGFPTKCHWRRSPRFGDCVAKNGTTQVLTVPSHR
ncbi:tissue inhibitor of metalloproteinase [Anopheles bellator]|uniref:tissue inhibitor of metalloproteinase n=1 Tax=Anopheles bellator TaxID=139047 RepID=UPI002648EE99|nr:tissue inhibitor of metalloproteinase [Anopheles bellator]XP_058056544.1 tissue inhibitor of metalloproteinase [Anopheles bellator]